MDLSFKPEHAAFRQEVRDFLDEELTDELREAGKLTASVFSEVEYSSKWHKILYKKGWIGSRWPKNMAEQDGMICKDISLAVNAHQLVLPLRQQWDFTWLVLF